jgi:hypothetical protein
MSETLVTLVTIRGLAESIRDNANAVIDEVGLAGAHDEVVQREVCERIIAAIDGAPTLSPTDPARIPQRIRDGLDRYAHHHLETGNFLRAVLENDLMRAFDRADAEVVAAMPAILAYVRCQLPGNCWGSPEVVSRWLSRVTVTDLGFR